MKTRDKEEAASDAEDNDNRERPQKKKDRTGGKKQPTKATKK